MADIDELCPFGCRCHEAAGRLQRIEREARAVVASIRTRCGQISKADPYGPCAVPVGQLVQAAADLERVLAQSQDSSSPIEDKQ